MRGLFILVSLFLLNGCAKPSEICEAFGGKWGSVNAECIRPSCAKTKTCGKWSSPDKWCDKVKIGDTKENLRFWLGEPYRESPNFMQWYNKLGEPKSEVKAEFNHNVLTRYACAK